MKIREQALWWLGVAERDLERAKRSLEEGDKGAATFWSQQAAEKALKAVLLATKGDSQRPGALGGSSRSLEAILA